MRKPILTAALVMLTGCSQSEPSPAEGGLSRAPATAPATAAAASASPATSGQPVVPDRFHGIWDYVKGSCDPASDMRTEIAERGITFYESHGAVTALTVDSPDRITVTLAMQGEGEKWTATRTLTLSSNGTILTPSGGGDTGAPMPLKRCS